ncbi:unnamed protein product [Linum trigynum]|uniref:Uncharacterized protein n=1 Tax=Linum trigynum TaxID=586398 RepID=A0AAV2DX65_9ROSI
MALQLFCSECKLGARNPVSAIDRCLMAGKSGQYLSSLGAENGNGILRTEGNEITGAPRDVIHNSIASCGDDHALDYDLFTLRHY